LSSTVLECEQHDNSVVEQCCSHAMTVVLDCPVSGSRG